MIAIRVAKMSLETFKKFDAKVVFSDGSSKTYSTHTGVLPIPPVNLPGGSMQIERIPKFVCEVGRKLEAMYIGPAGIVWFYSENTVVDINLLVSEKEIGLC